MLRGYLKQFLRRPVFPLHMARHSLNMKSSNCRAVALISVLLIAIAVRWLRPASTLDNPVTKNLVANPVGARSPLSFSDEEKDLPPHRSKRPDMSKNTSVAGLFEIKGREIASSAVHTVIPAGHSMVTGGYVTEDGRHEFVVLTPKWLETPSGGKQIMVESTILNVGQEALLSTGLNSLVTGEQKTLQNAEVWTPEDVTRTLSDTKGLDLLSSPSIVITPGTSAQVRMGGGKTSFMLDLSAGEASEGGFELKSEIKRVK